VSSPRGYWHQLPVIFRAVLAGILVSAAGEIPWSVLTSANLRFSPSIPWAVVAMAVWLGFYWRYFSGSSGSPSTRALRSAKFRRNKISSRSWLWSILSGTLAITSLIALEFILLRFFHFPKSDQPSTSSLPLLTLFPFAVMSAIASGVPEEVGFRGYMQVPIEQRRGPVFAVLFVAFVFALAHLSHGPSIALFFDFAFGIVFGALAYRTNSILPAMALHCFFDLIQFVAGRKIATAVRTLPLIWDSGPDQWLWIECAAFVLLGVASMIAFRKLAARTASAPPVAPDES
jgi:membrane protease YdiL (CAAX protease family)